jgi:hypothetical protein
MARDPKAKPATKPPKPAPDDAAATAKPAPKRQPPGEVGGPKGPEPTRYGDWQQKGRTTDF